MKSLLAYSCPVLVLAVGLISCTKQNESTLRVPEPNWETSQGVQKFSTVNQLTADQQPASRSVNDRLSFANSPSAQLRVTTNCRGESLTNSNDQIYYQQEVMIAIPSKIALFSLIPKQALSPSVLVKPLFCSFRFVAMNGDGATHSFHANELRVKDSSIHEGIEPANVVQKHEEPHFDKSEFRLRTTQAIDAKLICDYAEGDAHHSDNQKLALSEFKFLNEKFRQHPNENCRIIGIEKGVATMISAPFSVQFNSSGPVFETHARPTQDSRFMAPVTAYVFKIENQTNTTVRFQLPKLGVNDFVAAAFMSISSDMYCRMNGLSVARIDSAITTFSDSNSSGVVISEKEVTDIVLPSKASILGQIEVKFNWVGKSNQMGSISIPTGYILKLVKPIAVKVFTDDTAKETYAVDWNIDEVEKVGFIPANAPLPAIPCPN